MSSAHPWLLVHGGIALLGVATAGFCMCVLRSPAVRAHARGYAHSLDRNLRYLQSPLGARRLMLAQLLLISGFVLVATFGRTPWPIVLAAVAFLAPKWWLERAARQRTARIDAQLDTFMLALANALRANPALPAALAVTAGLIAAPLSRELALVTNENRLGVALDQALRHMAARVGSPAVSAAIAILRIARATGGDLSRTLEEAAASLREMARLEGVVRTKTAEGRAQTLVIAVVPLLLVAALNELDPQLLRPLWTTGSGQLIAVAAFALWGAALLLARSIVAVDV
jgi:tight adherence protein B